jgi:hypothetical protein
LLYGRNCAGCLLQAEHSQRADGWITVTQRFSQRDYRIQVAEATEYLGCQQAHRGDLVSKPPPERCDCTRVAKVAERAYCPKADGEIVVIEGCDQGLEGRLAQLPQSGDRRRDDVPVIVMTGTDQGLHGAEITDLPERLDYAHTHPPVFIVESLDQRLDRFGPDLHQLRDCGIRFRFVCGQLSD